TANVLASALATSLTENGLSPTWSAIASTETVSARDNTQTTGPGTNIPIYLINGTRVADDYDDFWDGTLQTAINVTPDDDTAQPINTVWTGTAPDGSISGSNFLGAGNQPVFGIPTSVDSNWVSLSDDPNFNNKRFYGISSVLTVEASETVPEPSALVSLFALGVMGAVYRLKKSQK
ncbi:MAG TPA: PEP-CTERM sorting domain-containing protein, partial [Cyanothece sp. UBA12306]|nr:PEP-CTERM sorting domain-containing protein [Cyanothece sp. UBA12306]